MSTPITVQISEEALIEALQQLPPERRRQLLRQLNEEAESQIVLVGQLAWAWPLSKNDRLS